MLSSLVLGVVFPHASNLLRDPRVPDKRVKAEAWTEEAAREGASARLNASLTTILSAEETGSWLSSR